MKTYHTPGPWIHLAGDRTIYTKLNDGCRGMPVAFVVDISPEPQANAKLIAAAPKMLELLQALAGNPSISLDDMIYAVRDAEGKGWDGPNCKAWGETCGYLKEFLKDY